MVWKKSKCKLYSNDNKLKKFTRFFFIKKSLIVQIVLIAFNSECFFLTSNLGGICENPLSKSNSFIEIKNNRTFEFLFYRHYPNITVCNEKPKLEKRFKRYSNQRYFLNNY